MSLEFIILIMTCSVGQAATGRFPYPATKIYFDFLQMVVSGPVPSAPQHLSKELAHFISCCLIKDPASRATAKQLLNHPFLGKAKNLNKKQAALWLRQVYSKGQQQLGSDHKHK